MVSWRGALIYKPLPNGSIYFDAGTSFNPSAEALSLSLATAPLPPVENMTSEIGTKWELLRRRLVGQRRAVPHRAAKRSRARPEQPAVQHPGRQRRRQGRRI